ncbi:PREDICTED: skin secretory protein xP2-like [Dipodomys ordii]|uniref:Skin secretory protein xP2-like n=1 Tax=Dipodomys ordii TaxID=10020 RepID=A0A1S3EW69_DIPOR|nr:PREDICTED: skin secretory protein xP2-like [Dipodomys ordii]
MADASIDTLGCSLSPGFLSREVRMCPEPQPCVHPPRGAHEVPLPEGHAEEPTQSHAEEPTQGHAEEPTQGHAEEPTQSHAEEPTQSHAEEGAHTEPRRGAHTEPRRGAHTEEPTQGHAEEPIQGHAEEPTQGHAEEPTQGHAEEPTQGHAEEPTQSPHRATQRSPEILEKPSCSGELTSSSASACALLRSPACFFGHLLLKYMKNNFRRKEQLTPGRCSQDGHLRGDQAAGPAAAQGPMRISTRTVEHCAVTVLVVTPPEPQSQPHRPSPGQGGTGQVLDANEQPLQLEAP